MLEDSSFEGEPDSALTLGQLALRLVLALAALFVCVALLGALFRNELRAFGREFVERFGLFGIGAGTFIADGFHCPVPPQFYMLMGVTSGVPALPTLLAVNLGSFLGGWCAFFVARRVARFSPIARRLEQPRRLMAGVFRRYGAWTLVVASVAPITYSALCYLAGLGRLQKRGFLVITLLRVPKLIFFYYLVRLGWLAG